MDSASWHLVLSRDGTVLGAAEGAPSAWLSRRLDECDDAPEDLKEAGRAILRRASERSGPVSATIPLASRHPSILLTVVDAVPLRRAPVDLRATVRLRLPVSWLTWPSHAGST